MIEGEDEDEDEDEDEGKDEDTDAEELLALVDSSVDSEHGSSKELSSESVDSVFSGAFSPWRVPIEERLSDGNKCHRNG